MGIKTDTKEMSTSESVFSSNSSGDAAAEERVERDEDADEEEEEGIRIGDIYIPPAPIPACTFDSTTPRLMITHISNTNFKSYAGLQELGPFHKRFTAIVGPNGSGKSNVIDSLLFVFGYRAQKIRSKKVSVLLHKSKSHPNVESCSVSVHFQLIIDKNDDEYEVVPDSKFVITRTAFKDNSSFYSINGRRVQFKEVSKKLKSYGIDLDYNRFLILQGEVEQIALMKPKAQNEHEVGMLGFLEDIIGSSRFKEPINILGQRVEEINEKRVEKYNRVKAVEKEKDELEEPRNEALEYVKLSNEIVQKTNIMKQIRKMKVEEDLETAKEEKEEVVKKLVEVKDALKQLKAENSEHEKGYQQITKTMDEQVKLIEAKQEQYSALERQDLQCRENIKHSKSKATKLKKLIESEQQKFEELKLQPGKTEQQIADLTQKEKELEVMKQEHEATMSKVMAGLQKETQSLQEEKEKHESQLIDLKKEVNETKSKMDIAQSELDILLSNESSAKSRLEELRTAFKTAKDTLEEKEKHILKIKPAIHEKEASLNRDKKELETVVQERMALSEKIKGDRVKVEEARIAMQAFHGRGKLLSALMEQKDKGNLPGIFGRLGDLGAIDQKYDIAISTACGALDHIVTDTIETAQKCVTFMKQHNLGIATFIALDKMDKWIPYTKQRIKAPESVPRLFDLVRVADERVLPAFYFALRDTLVADTLDQATRIGLQGSTRYRVVTLKGELIDISGTMSGGGRPAKGRMGQSVRQCDYSSNQIEDMTQQLEQMVEREVKLKDRQSSLESQIATLEKDLSILKSTLQKSTIEIQALKERKSSLQVQIKAQEKTVAEAAPDKAKVQSMTKNIETCRKAYEKASRVAGVVEEKVQSVHSKIMEITESRVSGIEKKLNAVKKEIDLTASGLSKAKVQLKTVERNMKKSEEKIKSTEEEIKENEDLNNKLREEYKSIEENALKIKEELEVAKEEKAKLSEKMAEVTKKVHHFREKESAFNRQIVDLNNELEKCNSKVKEYEGKIKHYEAEISNLHLEEVDEQPLEPLPKFTKEDLLKHDLKTIEYDISSLREQMKSMKPNMAAITEYRKKETLFLERVAELEKITAERDEIRHQHDELRKQRLNEFMAGFAIISTKLKEMYQMITLGGDAELELVDSLDPFSEGIAFSVRPPKKSWKNISNLSGGEKTLSSLALVFALHYYKPSPLYVMDEIDAALDFKNVSIIGNYIKERTKNAQFIIISLRNNMFELANHLVGIFKTYDCTQSVTINPSKLIQQQEENNEEMSQNGHITLTALQ